MKTGNNICPHCNIRISKLEVEDLIFTVGGKDKWLGFSCGCPSCRKIISVQMNPLTVASDYAKEVMNKLRG